MPTVIRRPAALGIMLLALVLPAAPAIAGDAAPATAGEVARPSVEELALPKNDSQDENRAEVQKPQETARDVDTREAMCLMIESAAKSQDLPLEFFARVIWQESRFQSGAIGPMTRRGQRALGIAQFMPGTASERRLLDPFDPVQALPKSAEFLNELRSQFGNLGLAAAAYNAGPRRGQERLEGRGHLPGETRAYVRIITGRTAEEWVKIGTSEGREGRISVIPCDQIAKIIAGSREASLPPRAPAPGAAGADAAATAERAAWAPWGLQLTGNWSEAQALAAYRDLQKKFPAILGDRPPLVLRGAMAGRGTAAWYRVRVAETTRERATQLCAKLESAGGKCLVYRN